MVVTRGRNMALGLYRKIMKGHQRYLPEEMRKLGDGYVRAEFKLHRKTTNEAQLDQFFTGWEQYLQQIVQSANGKDKGIGRDLPRDVDLSEEQRVQLLELEKEAKQPNAGGSTQQST